MCCVREANVFFSILVYLDQQLVEGVLADEVGSDSEVRRWLLPVVRRLVDEGQLDVLPVQPFRAQVDLMSLLLQCGVHLT